MTISTEESGWQLDGNSAEAYERYLVPVIFRDWAADLVARAKLAAGERVLDLACGTGIVARTAAEAVGPQGSIAAVDLNDGMLAVARTAAAGVKPPIAFEQSAAESLPYESGSFDAVLCEQGMQFFADPVAALREARRVLAPGGRAAVSVWCGLELSREYAAIADALERHAGPEAGAMMRSPFAWGGPERLREVLQAAGFGEVHVVIDVRIEVYPSVEKLLRWEAESSPLAGPLGALDAKSRDALVEDVRAALAHVTDDEGVKVPGFSYVAVAR